LVYREYFFPALPRGDATRTVLFQDPRRVA
jgi:hypothetical protein